MHNIREQFNFYDFVFWKHLLIRPTSYCPVQLVNELDLLFWERILIYKVSSKLLWAEECKKTNVYVCMYDTFPLFKEMPKCVTLSCKFFNLTFLTTCPFKKVRHAFISEIFFCYIDIFDMQTELCHHWVHFYNFLSSSLRGEETC